mgnify:CR=1 FL=1
MGAGEWNGKNHGGCHTGDGKKRNCGVYSMNGYRQRKIPNKEFSVGKRVAYIGSHKNFIHDTGTILSKRNDNIRSNRSTMKVQLEDGRIVYFYKTNLDFI